MLKRNSIYIILLAYALISAFTLYFFNGTGDNGDSIAHYLYARYAPYHPSLYFNHWAKPVYVLLASPFAQFGIVGIKLFNILISLFVILMTYRCAVLLQYKNASLVGLLLIFAPLFYILTFSGLTEPLFALFTVFGVYFCLKYKFDTAAIIISFLPYVRSEGLIIAGVFGLLFLAQRNWQSLFLLLFGSVFYSLAGYFIYHDFLWVFTKIPYSTLSSVYGSGELFHFVHQLVNVLGVPIYVLFCLGLLSLIYRWRKGNAILIEKILLVMGFLSFFIAHSLFWYLGIFNSMGLIRVFIGIMPIISLISLEGFNLIAETFLAQKPKARRLVIGLILMYVFVFPFSPNPSAVQWKKDMTLDGHQILAHQLKDTLASKKQGIYTLAFNHPYLSIVFDKDFYDDAIAPKITKESISKLIVGDLVIWDNLFAEIESGIKSEELDSLNCLEKIFSCTAKANGHFVNFFVYEKKETPCN